MASPAQPTFRIDIAINDLLRHSAHKAPVPPPPKGATLPEPVFPQCPELLSDPGPETPPETRQWSREHIMRKVRLAGSLRPLPSAPGGFSSYNRLSVRRVQMQPRLLVLLVVQ